MNNLSKKRVHIIGSVGVPACYGGWETLVENLLDQLTKNFIVTVYCSGKIYPKKISEYKGAFLKYLNIKPNGIQSIFYDFYSMILSIRNSDSMLILGVSGCLFLPLIRFFYNGRLIVAIDGFEWRRDKWGCVAKYFLKLSEFFAIKFAHIIISDNMAISNYLFNNYNIKSELISYGADHVSQRRISNKLLRFLNIEEKNYAFKVARIEPENNIHIILEAFSIFKKIKLVIVGNWNSSDYGIKLKMRYENNSSIIILDPIYDLFKLDELRSNCKFYVHGHSAGGTNPSLVEAMMLELPIIAFDVDFNRHTTNNLCYYFRDIGDLVCKLESLANTDFDEMAFKLKVYASEIYTWKYIGNEYNRVLSS